MLHLGTTPTRSLGLAALLCPASAQWAGEWPFDATSGITAADVSGNRNDGTLMNSSAAPWVAGKVKSALSFDGVDDYVAGFAGCTAYSPLSTSPLVGIGAFDASGSSPAVPIPVPAFANSLNDLVAVLQGVGLGNTLKLTPALLAQLGQ